LKESEGMGDHKASQFKSNPLVSLINLYALTKTKGIEDEDHSHGCRCWFCRGG